MKIRMHEPFFGIGFVGCRWRVANMFRIICKPVQEKDCKYSGFAILQIYAFFSVSKELYLTKTSFAQEMLRSSTVVRSTACPLHE